MGQTAKDCVKEAIIEYNTTMFGRNKANLALSSYEEKRGIFYNALRRAFDRGLTGFRFGDKVNVNNLAVKLRSNNTIESFMVAGGYTGYRYSDNDSRVLKDLVELGSTTFLDTDTHVDISEIQDFKFHF